MASPVAIGQNYLQVVTAKRLLCGLATAGGDVTSVVTANADYNCESLNSWFEFPAVFVNTQTFHEYTEKAPPARYNLIIIWKYH